MVNKYLVLWEFSRKQDYIFRSNKLKENVGASFIIKGLSENFTEFGLRDENFVIKGGGKSLYIFDNKDEGMEFIKKFSFNVLETYPGVELFIVGEEFDYEYSTLKAKIDSIYKKLETKKNRRSNTGGQVAFGMEVTCASISTAASHYDKYDKEFISSEIKVKRNKTNNNQDKEFQKLLPKGYEILKEIDDMTKDGSKSYIAIVHIDGNGMGKKMKSLTDGIIQGNNESIKQYNNRYFKSIREFSLSITRVYEEAFKKMSQTIEYNKVKLEEHTKINEGYFPLRPLILAGDDITYICNGAIGVESARIFIEEVEKNNLTIQGRDLGELRACAGISIVKKGYPFKRAYDLAESLCGNAKRAVLEAERDASAIDFHISNGEIDSSIGDIRAREYVSDDKTALLTMKPLFLDKSVNWKNYHNFIISLDTVKKAINEKEVGRGKIKGLREEFKKGPKATEMYFKFYKISEKKQFSYFEGLTGDYCFNTNEQQDTCMYLDAIEAMDYFVQLENHK